MNAYIRILKANPSIQRRQDGDVYLGTTYFSTMIHDDSTAKLKDQNEKKLSSNSYINLSPARYGRDSMILMLPKV